MASKDQRSEYVVDIGGIEHVFLLTAEDAEKYPNAKKEEGAAKRLGEAAAKQQAAVNKALQANTK